MPFKPVSDVLLGEEIPHWRVTRRASLPSELVSWLLFTQEWQSEAALAVPGGQQAGKRGGMLNLAMPPQAAPTCIFAIGSSSGDNEIR